MGCAPMCNHHCLSGEGEQPCQQWSGGRAHLDAAEHVGLEQLLVGEGVVDQRAVVQDGVHAAR